MCLDMHIKAMKEYILQLIAVIRQERMGSKQVGARVWGEKNAFFSCLVFNPYELAWILKIKIKNVNTITFSWEYSCTAFYELHSEIIHQAYCECLPDRWPLKLHSLGQGWSQIQKKRNKFRRRSDSEPSFFLHWNMHPLWSHSHFFMRTVLGLKTGGLSWSIPSIWRDSFWEGIMWSQECHL